MEIRRPTEKEAQSLSELISSVIKKVPYYSPKSKKEEIATQTPEKISWRLKNSKSSFYLISKEGGKVAGFLFGYLSTGLVHIGWVGVDKNYRRQGVAVQLIKEVEKFASKNKAHKIWLDTRINNKESIGLFKKLKYKKAATFKKHYWGFDFFIWEKLL